MTQTQAIKAKCLDCCGGSKQEVKECTLEECSLHPFRLGKNPNIPKRNLTEEQRAVLAARMLKARESRGKSK